MVCIYYETDHWSGETETQDKPGVTTALVAVTADLKISL